MPKQVISIRKATPDDVVALKDLVVSGREEYSFDIPEPEPVATMAWVLSVIAVGHTYVAEADGRIVGSIGMRAETWPWAPAARPFIVNAWFFVDEGYRKGGTGVALAKKMRDGATEAQVLAVLQITSGGAVVDLKDRLIQRLGFEYVGGSFIMRQDAHG
ncbi:MAG: GNAT family N-acetyltransferase [Parvibaculum sp.]|nr:GNAT family N-acetyltransferase [Parvibaculum sp.]